MTLGVLVERNLSYYMGIIDLKVVSSIGEYVIVVRNIVAVDYRTESAAQC